MATVNLTEFTKLATRANFFKSLDRGSLTPLMNYFQRLRPMNGRIMLSPEQQEQVQELVFFIPYEKKQKYRNALENLHQTAQIVISARPSEPKHYFRKFLAGPYGYKMGNQNVVVSGCSMAFEFVLEWKSSDGRMDSLRDAATREHVTFTTPPTNPPFNYVQWKTPIQFEQGGTSGANIGMCTDEHSNRPPALICAYPRVNGSLLAQQWYQYRLGNSQIWKNIPGAAYLIEKGVRDFMGSKVYYFKKTNWAQHNTKLLHFEAEFDLPAPPNPMPPPNSDLERAIVTRADLDQAARRVIARGLA